MIPEFSDPRLVAVFDAVNAYAPEAQPGFYAGLAAELGVATIVDVGCGTGLITCALAASGYRMIGAEPAPLMLEKARARPGGDRVEWIDGGVESVGAPAADLAIMTGHVAQFFVSDDAWDAALRAFRAALGPAGHLAFETRDPSARAWDTWTRDHRTLVTDPVAGPIECWTEVDDVRAGVVSFTNHYTFASGEELLSPAALRFRTESEVARSLAAAGFVVDRVYGDWARRPPDPTTGELIFVAALA